MSLKQIVTAEIRAFAQAVTLDEKAVTDKLRWQMALDDDNPHWYDTGGKTP